MPFGHSSKHQLLSNLHNIILLAKLRFYAEEMTDKRKTGFSINRVVYRFVQVYDALLKPNWEALHQWKLQSHWMSLQRTKEIVSSCWKKIFKTRQQPLSIFFGFISMKFFKEHIIKNPDEVIATISCAGFTGCSAKLHKFFISSLFHKYIKGLFKNIQVSCPEMTTATEIGITLFEKFLGQVMRSSFVTWSLSLVRSTQTLTALLQHCIRTATIWTHQCVGWSTFEMCLDHQMEHEHTFIIAIQNWM